MDEEQKIWKHEVSKYGSRSGGSIGWVKFSTDVSRNGAQGWKDG